MPRPLLVRAALAAAFAVFVAPAAIRAQPSTVVLVRHAEKADASADPALSTAGEARARALAAALAHARVDAAVTTQLRRTQLTAAPLMSARGLTPVVVSAGGDVAAHARAVAAAVRARPAGETVLVVGHSNTVPAIVAALGGPALPELCGNEYATLFVLTFAPPAAHGGPGAAPRLVRAQYGTPDAPDAGCPAGMQPTGPPASGTRPR